MERDFSQVVYRPIRGEYGETLPPLMVATGPFEVEMTRTGWNNPTGFARSNLQRVAYQLNDGKLLRYFWLVLDRAQDSEPIQQTLLDDVEDFRVNLLDQDGNSTDRWPDPDRNLALPAAAEIILVTKSLGEIRKVFVFTEVARTLNRSNEPGRNGNRKIAPTERNDNRLTNFNRRSGAES